MRQQRTESGLERRIALLKSDQQPVLHTTRVRHTLTRDQDRKLLTALKRQAVVSPFLGSDVTRLRDTGAAVGHKVEDVATTVLPGNGR